MLPYINVFGRSLPMYSVMIVIGVVLAVFYFIVCQKHRDFPPADGELALIYCMVGAFVGAKLLSLIIVLPEMLSEWHFLFTDMSAFLEKYLYSGFVFYGGLYGVLFTGWLYCRICKLNFHELIRSLLPMLPLIHGFGRLGCFCMGCCYGCVSLHFGIAFRASPIAPNGVPLLPVQLIEAIAEFILFFLLAGLARRKNSGFMMLGFWLIGYGILRFILEFFRGDNYRGFIGALSVSQTISLITVALGIFILVKKVRFTAKSIQR